MFDVLRKVGAKFGTSHTMKDHVAKAKAGVKVKDTVSCGMQSSML